MNQLVKCKLGGMFFVAVLALVFISSNARADFFKINLDPYANRSLAGTISSTDGPQGDVNLGGVPFYMKNVWHSLDDTDYTVDIAIDLFGIDKVYTVINTYWGVTVPDKAYIEFIGTSGASYTLNLIGGTHMRDFNPSSWTNTIASPDTTNVFVSSDGSGHRLDMQAIDLPDFFLSETLQTIRLTDSGGTSYQRMFIAGMTAEGIPVPEPATLLLLGAGLVALTGIRWRGNYRKS